LIWGKTVILGGLGVAINNRRYGFVGEISDFPHGD